MPDNLRRPLVNRQRKPLSRPAPKTRPPEPKRNEPNFAEFAYITAHNLKEPLRSLGICAGRLQKEASEAIDPHARELLQQILHEVHRMSDLVDDLFAYSTIDALEFAPAAVPLQVVLNEAMFALNSEIENADAEVTSANLPAVRGDQMQLTQLFKNLIGNSIKFRGSEAPRIRVSAETRGGEVLVRVEDNGMGIQPAYQEVVFKLFKRLHGREKYPGNGVGLAICRGIVERHGGRIWMEPNAQQGSIFSFTLPADKRGD